MFFKLRHINENFSPKMFLKNELQLHHEYHFNNFLFITIPHNHTQHHANSQNDRSVDISALAILGCFLLAILFGLLCYQLLRNRVLPSQSQITTVPLFVLNSPSSFSSNSQFIISSKSDIISPINRNSNSNSNSKSNSRSNSNSNSNSNLNLMTYSKENSNSSRIENSMVTYDSDLPHASSVPRQSSYISPSSVLQYLPMSLVPVTMGARWKGYIEISDLSPPTQDSYSQQYPTNSIESSQTDSNVDIFDHMKEYRSEIKKMNIEQNIS